MSSCPVIVSSVNVHCKVFYPVPTQYRISAGYVKCTYIMPQGQNSQFSRMRLWVTFPFQPCCYTVKLNLFIRVSKAILVCDQSQNVHVDIWTLCMWPLVCVSLGQAVHEPIPWALWKFMIGPTLTAGLCWTILTLAATVGRAAWAQPWIHWTGMQSKLVFCNSNLFRMFSSSASCRLEKSLLFPP